MFQGSYKNGTEGARDWRSMSGAYYLLRIIVAAVCSMNGNITYIHQGLYIVVVAYIVSTLAVLTLKPYKQDAHTITDSLILGVIALNSFVLYAGIAEVRLSFRPPPSMIVLYIASLLVPLFLIIVFVYFGVKRKYFVKKNNMRNSLRSRLIFTAN